MSDKSRTVWKGSLRVFAARLVSVALGIILSVASARLLGPAGRGEYAAALAGMVVGVQLFNLGLSASLLLLFSEKPEHIRRGVVTLWLLAGCWLALLLAGGFALSSFGVVAIFPFLRWWPIWAVWIPLQLLGLYQATCLTALRDYSAIIALELGSRIAMVALGLAALLSFRGSVAPFLVSLVLTDALIAVAGAVLLSKKAPRPTIERLSVMGFYRTALRIGIRAYPVLFLSFLVIRSDVLLLRGIRGAMETGIYSVAAQCIDFGLILPATVAAFIIPEIAGGRGSARYVVEQARRVLLYTAALSVLAAGLGAPLIRVVFGEPYRNAYGPLLLLLPGFIALSLQSVLMQYFNVKGYPLFVAGYWLLATLVNLGLNLLLIPRFGMYAAAATSSVSYGLICALALIRFRRETATPLRALLLRPSGGTA